MPARASGFDPDAYVVRYGPGALVAPVMFFLGAALGLGVAARGGVGVFAALAIALVLVLLGRWVGVVFKRVRSGTIALGVDRSGVLLGEDDHGKSEDFVLWSAIESVAYFRTRSRSSRGTSYMQHVGVVLKPTGPGRPGRPLTRVVQGWSLDVARLAAAVDRFAPDVPVEQRSDLAGTISAGTISVGPSPSRRRSRAYRWSPASHSWQPADEPPLSPPPGTAGAEPATETTLGMVTGVPVRPVFGKPVAGQPFGGDDLITGEPAGPETAGDGAALAGGTAATEPAASEGATTATGAPPGAPDRPLGTVAGQPATGDAGAGDAGTDEPALDPYTQTGWMRSYREAADGEPEASGTDGAPAGPGWPRPPRGGRPSPDAAPPYGPPAPGPYRGAGSGADRDHATRPVHHTGPETHVDAGPVDGSTSYGADSYGRRGRLGGLGCLGTGAVLGIWLLLAVFPLGIIDDLITGAGVQSTRELPNGRLVGVSVPANTVLRLRVKAAAPADESRPTPLTSGRLTCAARDGGAAQTTLSFDGALGLPQRADGTIDLAPIIAATGHVQIACDWTGDGAGPWLAWDGAAWLKPAVFAARLAWFLLVTFALVTVFRRIMRLGRRHVGG
jgi:hypothetical protein